MSEESVAVRLKGFIDQSGLTSSQFADQCGIPRPTLSQLLSGRNKKISDVIISQIHAGFPKLSVLWLLFGEGPMMVTPVDELSEENPSSPYEGDVEMDYEDEGDNISITVPGAQPRRISGASDKIGVKQQLAYEKRIAELEAEIERLKKSPRKVSQITVYYDDSTFETFIPSQRK